MSRPSTARAFSNVVLYGYFTAAVVFVLLPVAILILFSFSGARYARFP